MLLLLAIAAAAADVDLRRESPAGSARMVGLAGAYRAVAEGAIAQTVNPAAIAVRPVGSDPARWSGDGLAVAGGLLPAIRTVDPQQLLTEPLPTLDLQAGGVLGRQRQAGALTVGLRTLNDPESARRSTIFEVSGGWGASLLGDQLQLGAMVGARHLRTVRRGADIPELRATLPTLAVGARLVADGAPVQVGLSARAPWRTRTPGASVAAVSEPWEIGAGLATSRGERSRGVRATAGEPSARFLLASLDVVVVGPQRETLPLAAWTRDAPVPSDAPLSAAVALGAEAEVIPYFWRMRGGIYVQPPRLRDDRPRAHLTLGADVALAELPRDKLRWTLLPTLDLSVRGITPAVGIGLW